MSYEPLSKSLAHNSTIFGFVCINAVLTPIQYGVGAFLSTTMIVLSHRSTLPHPSVTLHCTLWLMFSASSVKAGKLTAPPLAFDGATYVTYTTSASTIFACCACNADQLGFTWPATNLSTRAQIPFHALLTKLDAILSVVPLAHRSANACHLIQLSSAHTRASVAVAVNTTLPSHPPFTLLAFGFADTITLAHVSTGATSSLYV